MLSTSPRKSRTIESVERINNALFLKSEYGLLRLMPQSPSIVRISYTLNDAFPQHVCLGVEKDYDFDQWTYEESDLIILKTEKLQLEVNPVTGTIQYFDQNHQLLLAEKSIESRHLQPYQAYKTIVDENTKFEETDTPDGKKRVITEATKIQDRELYHTRTYFSFQESEKIYGMGQAEEGSLNLRGTTQYLHQANLKIAIPMMLSTAGYGILFATDSASVFNDNEYGTYFATYADVFLDFYFIAGPTMDHIVKDYRYLSGKAAMLPRWAFGFLQSQERYETQAEILQVVDTYREKGIGLDCIILDWFSWAGDHWGQKTFDLDRFPDPKKMIETLHETQVNFMISIWPIMKETSGNYKEFFDQNLLLPANNIYDAFNQEARDLYWKQTDEGLFHYGIDAWWCDSSEPCTPEWGSPLKPSASDMYQQYINVTTQYMCDDTINAYGLVHAQALYEGQTSVSKEKRVMNLTRNGYIGAQKYGAVLWSGDTYASWETLQKQIVAGLNFCATGLPYWTLDIGAFFVKESVPWFWDGKYQEGLDDLGYRELFVRWYQYGAFLPIFRSHGTDVRREMWLFDGENHMFYDALVAANELRYQLMPYIYSLAGHVYVEDGSMMKMLAFDFPTDEKACTIKDQYMFGDAILVCPVTTPMYYEVNSEELENISKEKEVYLPMGSDWFDFYTNTFYTGGQTITVKADISAIPLFVKAGSILPMTTGLQSTAGLDSAKITLHIYPGKDCTYTLYEDSGNGYDYEDGSYKLTTIEYKNNEIVITPEIDRFDIKIH